MLGGENYNMFFYFLQCGAGSSHFLPPSLHRLDSLSTVCVSKPLRGASLTLDKFLLKYRFDSRARAGGAAQRGGCDESARPRPRPRPPLQVDEKRAQAAK